MGQSDVRHEPASGRFVTGLDGAEGVLEYHRAGDTLVITHTMVPEAIAGRGVAGHLVEAAFEHAREEGLTVRPVCSYAAGWAQRHQEYAGLVE